MKKKLTEDDLNELDLVSSQTEVEALDKENDEDEREQRDAPMGEPSMIDFM